MSENAATASGPTGTVVVGVDGSAGSKLALRWAIEEARLRGDKVLAADNGVVAYAGDDLKGFGNLVLIKHAGGFVTTYAHNDKLLVSEGARVKAGQPIAHMGDTEADAVMLHFEIRKNGTAVDPAQYLPSR